MFLVGSYFPFSSAQSDCNSWNNECEIATLYSDRNNPDSSVGLVHLRIYNDPSYMLVFSENVDNVFGSEYSLDYQLEDNYWYSVDDLGYKKKWRKHMQWR